MSTLGGVSSTSATASATSSAANIQLASDRAEKLVDRQRPRTRIVGVGYSDEDLAIECPRPEQHAIAADGDEEVGGRQLTLSRRS